VDGPSHRTARGPWITGAALLVGAAWFGWWWGDRDAADAAPAVVPAPTVGGPPPGADAAVWQDPLEPAIADATVRPLPANAPHPAGPGIARIGGRVELPALNGVREPTAITWPPGRPWSPVIGVATDNGWDWYVHGDGTWSTTAMVLNAGMPVGAGLLRAPVAAVPLRR